MDGFHLSNRQLRRLGRAERKGAPDTFDVAGYRSLLGRIRAGDEDVYAPVFDRRIEESIAAAVVVPVDVPLVVTEGNYLLLENHGWAPVRRLLDTVWYIDVARAERVRRLEARRRSHGHDAATAAAWVRDVDEPNAAIVESTRARADCVIHLAESDSASHTEGAGA
jgi:pantothenate kinase